MEFIARITQEHKLDNLWKYTFLDIESNQQDWFYHKEQISYNPNVAGKLDLTENKFFKLFEQEISDESKKNRRIGILTKLERKVKQSTRKFLNDYPKRQIKLSFNSQYLHELHQTYTWKQIAKIYGKHEQTVYYWLKTNNKEPKKRGTKPRITNKTAYLIRDYALKNNTKTQQEIADYVCKELNIPISRPSITVLLKKLGITRKKLTYHYNQLDEAKAKKFNKEIKPLLDKYPFIALDECSFYPNLDPRFGYSLKGSRAIAKKPSYKGKHYTLLFAISNLKKNGVIHWKLIEKGANWKIFYDFLEEINPIGNTKNILLMDNAKIHTAPTKREEAKLLNVREQMLKKNIEVKFIVTYSPMLNPTELVFCLLRQQTEKSRPRSYEEMKKAIEKVVELLNTKDLSKYFWHCANYFDRKDAKNSLETIKKL